jgi:hypothetical protein
MGGLSKGEMRGCAEWNLSSSSLCLLSSTQLSKAYYSAIPKNIIFVTQDNVLLLVLTTMQSRSKTSEKENIMYFDL